MFIVYSNSNSYYRKKTAIKTIELWLVCIQFIARVNRKDLERKKNNNKITNTLTQSTISCDCIMTLTIILSNAIKQVVRQFKRKGIVDNNNNNNHEHHTIVKFVSYENEYLLVIIQCVDLIIIFIAVAVFVFWLFVRYSNE